MEPLRHGFRGIEGLYVPRGAVQSQASRPAGHNGHLPLEREDVAEILELDVRFCRHGGCCVETKTAVEEKKVLKVNEYDYTKLENPMSYEWNCEKTRWKKMLTCRSALRAPRI